MSDHLPECDSAFTDLHTANCVCRCICPELRACEARVLTEAPVSVFVKAFSDGKAVGYDIGLSAAREAVEAIGLDGDPRPVMTVMQGHYIKRYDALAAIDALKEKP